MTIPFSNSNFKTFVCFQAFLVPNLGTLAFRQILQIDKFEVACFKYGKIVSKFWFKNIQNKYFWTKIWASSLFCEVLQTDKFEGAGFKYGKIVSKFQSKNIEKRHFWCQIWAFLFFREVLQRSKVDGADFKYGDSFLTILHQTMLN